MAGEPPCYAHLLTEAGLMPDQPRVIIQRVYEVGAVGIGKRILVDRVWPRGIKRETLRLDAWLRDLAPSDELRKWFGHDPNRWDDFQQRYLAELKEPSRQAHLAELIDLARYEPVTLLYGARDELHNQAVVLRFVVEAALARGE